MKCVLIKSGPWLLVAFAIWILVWVAIQPPHPPASPATQPEPEGPSIHLIPVPNGSNTTILPVTF